MKVMNVSEVIKKEFDCYYLNDLIPYPLTQERINEYAFESANRLKPLLPDNINELLVLLENTSNNRSCELTVSLSEIMNIEVEIEESEWQLLKNILRAILKHVS